MTDIKKNNKKSISKIRKDNKIISKKGFNRNLIISVILVIFIIILAVQSFQLNNLKNNVENGQVKIISSGGNSYPSTGNPVTSKVNSPIQNLPSEVGGC